MPAPLYQQNANYTLISAIGTGTINPGPTSADVGGANPGRYGVLYGFTVLSTGTAAMGITFYDVVVSGTTTNTNTLFNGTATAPAQNVAVLAGGVGIRYRGTLIYITTGTAANINALWD